MTIINNTYEFIFVHIPKCGGSSVTASLSTLTQYNDIELGATPYGQTIDRPYRTRFGLHKHSTAADIRGVVGRPLWSRYYTFGVVRNPYRRAISAYTYLKTYEQNYELIKQFPDFNAWVQSAAWQQAGPDGLNMPQHRWLRDGVSAQMVDEVFRLEDLVTDMQPLLRQLRLNEHQMTRIKLGKNNPSRVKVAPETIEDRTIELIRTRYELDFKLYGYSVNFPRAASPPNASASQSSVVTAA